MSATTRSRPASGSNGSGRVRAWDILIDDALLDQVASALAEHTGLVFPPARRPLLARAVATCLREFELDPTGAVDRLTVHGSPAWRRLVSLARVGETYFFRHPEQLEAFRDLALGPLIRARQADARPSLRLWCAGCSTGEEAYSLAILVQESLPDPVRWDVRVVGTDIDTTAIERARAAVYGRWSFRIDGRYRARWFEHVAGGERVSPAIRERVVFEEHNLADPSATLPVALSGPADVIVCRNVTMYMSPEVAGEIAGRWYDALRPGGWLLVGPVEPSAEISARFVSHQHDGFTIYQRPVTASAAASFTPLLPGASAPTAGSQAPRSSASLPPPPAGTLSASGAPGRTHRPRPAEHRPALLLREARALADGGDLGEAERRCRQALALDPRLPAAYVLLAAIEDARGDLDGACHALGRAIYLRHADPVPHFRLGLLEWRRGRATQAHARMRTALRLLDGRPDGELIDDGSGLTAGRARSVITSLEV